MRTNFCLRGFFIGGVLLLFMSIICFANPSTALAQCGVPPKSSCANCHSKNGSVNAMGDWNEIHMKQDLCIHCHGGNATAMDKNIAHQGLLAQPLSDIYTDCHSCHPDDYAARSEQMAAELNLTINSCATPSPTVLAVLPIGPDLGNRVFSIDRPGTSTFGKSLLWIAGGSAILGGFILALGWIEKNRVEA